MSAHRDPHAERALHRRRPASGARSWRTRPLRPGGRAAGHGCHCPRSAAVSPC